MATKKYKQVEMCTDYNVRLYENKSKGKYAEVWGEGRRLFNILTHNEEALKASIIGYKAGLKNKAHSNDRFIPELRLLGMNVTATRRQINSNLDIPEADICRL